MAISYFEEQRQEPHWETQERADRNRRVAQIIAEHLVQGGNAEDLLGRMQGELSRSGGCCGEGSFESKMRHSDENDWKAVVAVLNKAVEKSKV